ncbi:hypothetical protein DLJ57_07720, partial [Micromonospora chalcea]
GDIAAGVFAAAETLGGAVEVAAPGRVRHRRWPPHPSCGCCRRRPIRSAPAAPGRTAAARAPSR